MLESKWEDDAMTLDEVFVQSNVIFIWNLDEV